MPIAAGQRAAFIAALLDYLRANPDDKGRVGVILFSLDQLRSSDPVGARALVAQVFQDVTGVDPATPNGQHMMGHWLERNVQSKGLL
jgi:hypothetical protein